MKIMTTAEAEYERINNLVKPTWGLFSSISMVQAIHKAVDLGWKDKAVQVRSERIDNETWYIVEPFEKDCGCPNMLRYADYAPERESFDG